MALGMIILGTLIGVAAGAMALASGAGLLAAITAWSCIGTISMLASVLWAMISNDQADRSSGTV